MFIVYRKLTEKCVNDLILSYSDTKVIFYKLPFYRLKRDLYHRALLFT